MEALVAGGEVAAGAERGHHLGVEPDLVRGRREVCYGVRESSFKREVVRAGAACHGGHARRIQNDQQVIPSVSEKLASAAALQGVVAVTTVRARAVERVC